MFMQGRSDIFVPGTSAVAWVDKTHINMMPCQNHQVTVPKTKKSTMCNHHYNLDLAFSLQIPSCLEFL